MLASLLNGDTLHIVEIDLPIAFVLVAPLLLLASARRNRNEPLIVPAVMLFVLGLSSLYVALVESPSAGQAFRNVHAGAEILQHGHDLVSLAISTLAAATLLFVLGLLFRNALVIRVRQTGGYVTALVCGIVYAFCAVWVLMAAHQGAKLAKHLAEHAQP
jgi:hypothetical protein